MIEPALYLIPTLLSDVPVTRVLPASNVAIVQQIKHFIVENVRTARRFIKRCDPGIDIDGLHFSELNRHTPRQLIGGYLAPLEQGLPVGVLSEAGCPAIADPGADVVALAQQRQLPVRPLVGPSSILLGLMGSGFNGQSFAFLGYLPIDAGERARKFKEMERRIMHEDQTQIFIETPYRNNRLLAEMARALPPALKLCVATDLTGGRERIVTRPVRQWAAKPIDLNKVPTIFLLYK